MTMRNTLVTLVGAISLAVAAGGSVGCGDDDGDGGSGGSGGSTTTTTTTTTSSAGGAGGAGGSGGGGMADCMTTVCVTYGAAVPTVASQITDRAATDPMFMADFQPLVMQGQAAVDAFKASLTSFITDAYGCTTGTYTGPTMEAAHTGLGITQAEYDAFIALIADVLADNGVPQQDITECYAPPLTDPTFAGTIIGQ